MNPFNTIGSLSLTLLSLTVAFPTLAMPFSTKIPPSSSLVAGGVTRLQFPSSSDRGSPVTTTGGGTRGPRSCINKTAKEDDLSLNALTPNFSNNATTASLTPTFFFYIPATSAKSGEFILTDSSDQKIYQKTISLPAQPGIMAVPINPTTPLSLDNYYQWSFNLICDATARDRDFTITGTLEVKPLEGKIPIANPLETAKYYARQSLWLDTIASLAPYYAQYADDWSSLLTSAGLDRLIEQPVIDDLSSKWPVNGELPDRSPLTSPPKMPSLPITNRKDSKLP